MAVGLEHLWVELLTAGLDWDVDGMSGDPSRATVELGNIGMDFLVDAAMTQINELLAE